MYIKGGHMMNEYQIVADPDVETLEELVAEALNNGWRCQGGILAVSEDDGYYRNYMQAMVRKTKP